MSEPKDLSLAPPAEQAAAVGRGCPKCSYRRRPGDTAPPWQCPRCGIVYDKYLTGPAAERAAEQRRAPRRPEVVIETPRRWPWVVMAVVVAAAAYGGWQWKRKPAKASPEVLARLSEVDKAKRALQADEGLHFAFQQRVSREESRKAIQAQVDEGSPRAMVAMGMFAGRQDNPARLQWLNKAANEGEPAAFVNLGYIYEMGDGVPRERETAANWYTKAARQGDATGLYSLGHLHAKASDIARNPRQAYLLFLLADREHQAGSNKQDWLMPHERSPFGAKGMAIELEKELSPVDLVKAREFVEAWKPGQPLPQM
jgi:TPR repeat protein